MSSEIPRRNPECRASLPSDRHVPGPGGVESGHNNEMEWQYATCLYCQDDISRYRLLRGGTWFDPWGTLIIEAFDVGSTGGQS